MITKQHLRNAVKALQESGADVGTLKETLMDIIEDDENQDSDIDLIDRNHYFASILWQEKDVRSELMERGYAPSDKNVSEVMSELDTDSMEDCSDAWEFIYKAIDDTSDRLDKLSGSDK